MSIKLKLYLGRKVIDSINKSTKFTSTDLLPLIHVGNTTAANNFELHLPLDILEDRFGVPNVNQILKIQPDDIIKNIGTKKDRANRKITFEIDRTIFVQDVLENCSQPHLNLKPKTIVIDFSSPNIAKPFHLGHLRSTIIGNFIGNLHSFLSHKVTKINYLGDWGTQFGFIKVGVDELKYSQKDIKRQPLKRLYESYVYANKLAEKNEKITERARQEFNKLEKGPIEFSDYWKEYMQYSKEELEVTYKRLGVTFDEYNFESAYSAKRIQTVIDVLTNKNIAQTAEDGKLMVDLEKGKKVPVLKSDGSTLYLTRDIAAAVDRFNKYHFDKMLYVVDNSQSDHFNTLKAILHKMNYHWAERLHHVKFGRIRGMSSRKGTAVFLRDILDECRDLMIKKQIESPNTRVPVNNTASDILGVSCVIINDLKQRRQKDYDFTWEKVLQVQGDSGIKLQYTHCRLYSLKKNSGAIPPKKIYPEFIQEPIAIALVGELARFPEILYKASEQLEATLLVTYLFHLCNHINKAFKLLQIKNSEPEIASQRLLLFSTAQQILGDGMRILGLQPLNEM